MDKMDIGRIAVLEPMLYQVSKLMLMMLDKDLTVKMEVISAEDSVAAANLKRMRNSLRLISAAIEELLNADLEIDNG